MNTSLTVILNPKSGSAGDDFAERVTAALKAQNADFEVIETTKEKSGEALAREALQAGAKHLVACGGDGTVMSVVNGIGKEREENKDLDCLLSIVPGGTANLLATALEIPVDLDKAVEIALNGVDKTIDLGKCGPYYFALGVGVGLTERLVSQASAEEKERLGKLAYVKAMFQELGARPTTFVIKLDNRSTKRLRGVAIVVANSGTIGGNLHFAPRAKMDDGLLDLCILHRFWLRDAVRMIWNSLLGKLPADRAVSFYQAKRIEVRSNPPLDSQVDGEVQDVGVPLIAEAIPRALRVRVPQEQKEKSKPDNKSD